MYASLNVVTPAQLLKHLNVIICFTFHIGLMKWYIFFIFVCCVLMLFSKHMHIMSSSFFIWGSGSLVYFYESFGIRFVKICLFEWMCVCARVCVCLFRWMPSFDPHVPKYCTKLMAHSRWHNKNYACCPIRVNRCSIHIFNGTLSIIFFWIHLVNTTANKITKRM